MAAIPPLEALRAEIDDLDRALLRVLARRMAVVTEIAGWKRATGTSLRDLPRERLLREDRARTAVSMGLPAGLADGVFRAVLRSSRQRLGDLGVPRGSQRAAVRTAEVLSGMLRRGADWLDDR